MLLSISEVKAFFDQLVLPAPMDEAADLLLNEVRTRLGFLCQVGLGYLTLDRQSRTLSGGEVQRINLTTALGTSLVNTLFVLDEPSIGLHPRDMGRVIDVMKRLRNAGVSGSGKSTLVQDVLYPALRKSKGKPTEAPGAHRALKGAHQVSDVVLVDQSPIGKTTRSNPASYAGAFDCIRALFAKSPVGKERGYTPGTFSFNSGNGRCPACGGNGFEHVEMQFLSDVYLRCPDCDGRRYRAEVLEATIRGKSIADALDMTVSEALRFFGHHAELVQRLQPLVDVGLDYLKLGQPVPTLSGGEAQRLKLAGYLAETEVASDPKLFLFDEPTTGLHFDDVAKLLRAFRRLLGAGHSLIVIEHNLDVMRASDWIVDLGPEGGAAGGEVVCEGTPAQVMKHPSSHTGKALRDYELSFEERKEIKEPRGKYLGHSIRIHKAREHNLKNIDVEIPRGRFTVVTGVSGSGKSTLAFDILFAEGQRRYLESLNAYARQFVQAASRPDVDAIFGIPPTGGTERGPSRGGRKSRVGTLSEAHHFLRLLFVKLGTQFCPDCDVPIEPQSEEMIAARIFKAYRNQKVTLLAPLVVNRKGVYTALAKWARGKGYWHLRVDGKLLPTRPFPRIDRFKEHTIELPVGEVLVSPKKESLLRTELQKALEIGKGVIHVLAGKQLEVYSTKRACRSCGRSFPELDPRLFSYNSKHGWCAKCYGTGLAIDDVEWSDERARTGAEDNVLDSWIEWLEIEDACPQCEGRRLNPEALAVRWQGKNIAEYAGLPIDALKELFTSISLKDRAAEIARDIVAELKSRLGFLGDVGLGYLTLDRSAPTLSGGEAQRIRLAAQLRSNLRGVCYILDEPTIGLHHPGNRILLDVLEKLEAKGNSLVGVEHDEETIRRAQHVIDLGPGAGRLGGHVIAEGSAADLAQNPDSMTGRFLKEPLKHPLGTRRI